MFVTVDGSEVVSQVCPWMAWNKGTQIFQK